MKTMSHIFILILFPLTLASCQTNHQNVEVFDKKLQKPPHSKAHWSYSGETGPEHWAEVEKNSECDGKRQSPINILTLNTKKNADLPPLDIQYSSSTIIHDVINNGHSIEYDFEAGDYINYKSDEYVLKQIHFHEPAEHTINGVRYPLVIHMVHQNTKGAYLVLAVMAIEGEESAPFAFLESYLPIQVGEMKIINESFNLNLNLPNNKAYFHYIGSLTTPPCSQGVLWFIFQNPVTVSLEQVTTLNKLMPHHNYRDTQPLNGRIVEMAK